MPMYEAHSIGGPKDFDVVMLTDRLHYLDFPMITMEDIEAITIPHPEPDKPIPIRKACYRLYKELRGNVLLFKYLGD